MSRLQIAIAVDQLVNALTGGYADETFSARAWRKRDAKGWKHVRAALDALWFWQPAHCADAFQSEMDRKHLPSSYNRSTTLR